MNNLLCIFCYKKAGKVININPEKEIEIKEACFIMGGDSYCYECLSDYFNKQNE